jgi:hypothetical protein
MTMATENRGGNRPTAPQNNYGVSATGGAGSAGKQPTRYTAGMDNAGEYQAIQSAEPLAKSGVSLPTGSGGAGAPVMPMTGVSDNVVPLSAPTQRPDEPVTAGAAMGPGPGPEAMSAPTMLSMQNNQDLAKMAAYLPIYQQIAEQPHATNAMRNFVRWMQSQI